MKPSFCIWFTGLPASGKSRLAGAVADGMRRRGLDPVVLESDALRRLLTPEPDYLEKERGWFYGTIVELARMFVEKGVPVLIDATGNRRAYRARGRQVLHLFAEVRRYAPRCLHGSGPEGDLQEGTGGREPHGPRSGGIVRGPRGARSRLPGDQPAEAGASKVLVFMEERGWIE